ncbi:hypothetical protein CFIO01_05107 [Colletotrichum fioriniae PJ7]|uniref:Uncharacterized protein n=1 Tax=Colletotrichum fioriniae PJ7 TaxID=1445577 RepID=A0A010RX08_9PEZI|nr:hypothetical protein CFIO01_05107 [Colletotrichum fioriniae PJ7]
MLDSEMLVAEAPDSDSLDSESLASESLASESLDSESLNFDSLASDASDPQVGGGDIPKDSDIGGELEDGELVGAFYDHQVGSAVEDAEVLPESRAAQDGNGKQREDQKVENTFSGTLCATLDAVVSWMGWRLAMVFA